MEVLNLILDAVITAVVIPLLKRVMDLSKEMRDADKRNRAFEMSMQREEIIHAFQRHVEDGKPITIEEMEHLDKCYDAYKANGGNDVGDIMYEKVRQFARLVTKVDERDEKIGGTD